MNPAYRVPVDKLPFRDRFTSQENATSTPITEMVANSLITSHRDSAKINTGKVTVSGMAWDGGYGVNSVQVSTDGGKTWTSAKLGQDGDGQRHQQAWPEPDVRVDFQPSRLPQQCDAKHHIERIGRGSCERC